MYDENVKPVLDITRAEATEATHVNAKKMAVES